MATLFNTKIKDTYQSLLKLEDNTILTTTSKNITDGLGNASPLYMSTTQVRIGSTSASALYWDNVNNRLGIGTSSPAYKLDVSGTGRFSDTITYNGNLTPLSTSSAYSVGLSSTSVGGRITAYTNNGASGMQYFNFGYNSTSLITDGGFTNTTHNGVGFAITSTLGYGGTGGGTYTTFLINPTLNFAGNPNPGTYRAIYYNPTLTNLTNATHVAIETVTGNVILGSTSGNLLLGTTTDNGAKLRIESGDLSLTGYQPKIILNGTATSQSYIKTNLAIDGSGVFGGIGMNTDIWLTSGSGSGGYAGNVPATIHFKVNGTNPLTSTNSHWWAGDNGKSVGYEFLTTHYRSSVPAAWYGPEISGGVVGLQQFNIGYEPKQYAGAGFTFVGVGLSGAVSDPFTRVTEFNPIRIDYSLASGGSNITARGVYYKPTFTSVYPLLVNNAFESTSGSLVMSGEASRVSSTIGRGAYLNQTLRPANMTGDTLIGLDINPTFTSSATQISTFTYVGGSGYTLQTIWENIPLTGGTGTGATVNITVGAGNLVTAVTMANRGTGYTVNDVLTLPAQNIFTAQAGGSGFSVTVTAVGASTYNSYGLLVRNGLTSNTTSTPPTGYQGIHTAGSNSLYWKIGQGDKYAAVFENTAGYGDGVLIKVANNTHSGLLVTSNNATLLDVSDDVGGVYSPKITSGSRVAWLSGYVEHAGGVGTNIYGNGATPFITLREYSYHVGIGTTSPSARLTVTGGGSTSATSSLLVQNSLGRNLIQLRDDGASIVNGDLYVTNPSFTGNLLLQCIGNYQQKIQGAYGENIAFGTGGNTIVLNATETSVSNSFYAGNMGFTKNAAYQGGTLSIYNFTCSNTGINYGLTIGSSYVSTGAGGPNYGKQVRFYENLVNPNIQCDITFAYVNPTINYTSTGNGQIVGFDFNPVVTAVTANTKVRAFQSSYGGAYINTTTYQDSAVLQVDSTTQGVLFPRMTTAQKLAIASPVGGLVVYDTTTNKLCCYNGTTWNDLF